MTGAYIQDWGISAETKLKDVRCDYVYMRLPTRHDPDPCRKPDNKQEKFQEKDFTDRIAEKYPEAKLEIMALEGRGDEKIRVQAKVTGQADRSKLSEEYFENYRELSGLRSCRPSYSSGEILVAKKKLIAETLINKGLKL